MAKLWKRTLTRYQKILAGEWIAAGALLCAGTVCFYLPQHETLRQMQAQYKETAQQADLAQKAASEKTRLELEQQNQKVTSQLGVFTIPDEQVSSLVFEVGRMAGQLNLAEFSSKSINSGPEDKSGTGLRESWLAVEFAGTYEQFARFVNLLERNKPAIFVEKVVVSRDSGNRQGCKYQMELSILTTSSKTPALALAGSK
ncbi:MAG: hypothetical protein LLF76_05175 [Planctomycetaceae bacterium]|nr:hypothetical protein [Planctomycetaceae bacterium]